MGHSVGLVDITRVIGKYVDQYNLVAAGGPLAATGMVRAFVGKNRVLSIAVGGSTAWFAVKELSGPVLGLMQDQFGSLQAICGSFR